MSKPKKPAKRYIVNVTLPQELYEKIHRIADRQDRSAGAVLRRLIVALPDSDVAEAS